MQMPLNRSTDVSTMRQATSLFICHVEDIQMYTGITAQFCGHQVAIFRCKTEFYALSNYDPFSQSNVMSQGLLGEINGRIYVASPVYKDRFDLKTGLCLDHVGIQLTPFKVFVKNACVYLAY